MDRISAFMDGETGQHEGYQTMMRIEQHPACCDNWAVFHLIRDVLHGEPPILREDFASRIHDRLRKENTVLAPRFRWRKAASYALSAAASLAAVAVVLALVLSDNSLRPAVQIVAAPRIEAVQPTPPMQPAPTLARARGGINEYLMAHQEFSPSTAFQGVIPYVRTVSSPRDGSGR